MLFANVADEVGDWGLGCKMVGALVPLCGVHGDLLELQFGDVTLYGEFFGKFGEILFDEVYLEAVTEGIEHVTVHLWASHYMDILHDDLLRFLAFHSYSI